jgi:hypothetical protein
LYSKIIKTDKIEYPSTMVIGVYHYILTIKFEIPNIPQTLVPYKDEKGRLNNSMYGKLLEIFDLISYFVFNEDNKVFGEKYVELSKGQFKVNERFKNIITKKHLI